MTAAEFWNWFVPISSSYTFIDDMDDNTAIRLENKLTAYLRRYCKGLDYFIHQVHIDEFELIFTAHGCKEFFDQAEQLAAAAPAMSNWRVFALVPAHGEATSPVRFGDMVLDPAQLRFIPLDYDKQMDRMLIRISIPNFDFDRWQDYAPAIALLMRYLVGEKDSVLVFSEVEVCRLPDDFIDADYLKLKDLYLYLHANRHWL